MFYLDKNENLQPQKDLSKIFLRIAADVKKQNKYTKADRHNFSKIIIKEIKNTQCWQ